MEGYLQTTEDDLQTTEDDLRTTEDDLQTTEDDPLSNQPLLSSSLYSSHNFGTFKWIQIGLVSSKMKIFVIFRHAMVIFHSLLVIFCSLQVTLCPINLIYHLPFIIENHFKTFKWIQTVLDVVLKETTNFGHLPIYLGHLPQSVGHPVGRQSIVQPTNIMYYLYHLPS